MEYKKYTVVGLSEYGKPTPAWVKRTLAVSLVLLGGVSTYVHGATFISVEVKEQIMYAAGTLAGTLSAIAPLFGVRTKSVNR